ncbi:MAG: tetratricopeptide repeat protein [Cyanothece sp. SIO1E1]|nr:tetratricopeptide repeat protein [Cyanothece sp. SIO1E1]
MMLKKLKGLLALICFCGVLPSLGGQSTAVPQVSLEEIDELLKQERYEDAYPLLKEQVPFQVAKEDWPRLAHVYLWLGECAYVVADYPAALDYTQSAEAIVLNQVGEDAFPEFGMLLQNLGVFYSRAGDFDQQMTSYQRHFEFTVANKGKNSQEGADAYYNLGMAYLRRNQWQKTQAYLDTSLEISEALQYETGIGDALNILAICYANNGDYAQAASVQRQALKFDSAGYNYSVKLNNLAEYQLNLKQYADAKRNFEKAIEVGPNNWGPRLNLIRLYRLQQKWQEAEELTDRWISLLEGDRVTWASELKRLFNYKASFFHRQKDWASALRTLNQGLRLKAVDPTIDASLYLLLASTHLGNKDYQQALIAVQRLYQLLFPDEPDLDLLQEPSVETLLNAEVALEVLTLKGRIYQGLLTQQADLDIRRAAVGLYQKAEQLIQRNRERYASVASKSLLAQSALSLYQDAMELMYSLYQNTGEMAWWNKRFTSVNEAVPLALLIVLTRFKQTSLLKYRIR